MSDYTAQGLADYATMCLSIPTAYMWGGIMRKISTNYVDQKARQYPAYYSRARKDYLKQLSGHSYGCDCAGLIKSYYWGGLGSPKYNANTDLNTNGMYGTATVVGPIDSLPEEPGIVLYMAGHVGVYIGCGYAVECTLGQYGDGVVKTKVKGRGWTHWLKIPTIEYGSKTRPVQPNTYTVQPGDSFWRIAELTLGNGSKYMDICKANNMVPTSVIHPGDVLKIPTKEVKS